MKTLLLLAMISYCCPLIAQTDETVIGVSLIGISVIGKDSVAVNTDTLGAADFAQCSSLSSCFIPTITDFTGERVNPATVLLNWTIAAGQFNKGFGLERAFNQRIQFSPVAYIPGNANTSALTAYSYTDPNGFEGISYYRLRLENVDGSITYSKIVAVTGTPAPFKLILLPNPTTGHLLIRLPASQAGAIAHVSIQTPGGAVVFRNNYPATSGALSIDFPPHLPGGNYLIRVLLDKAVLQSKVLLMRK